MDLSRRDFLKYGGAAAAGSLVGGGPPALGAAQSVIPTLRIKEAKAVPGVCPSCAVGCPQLIYVKDGRIIDIEGDPDAPHTEGALCPRGSATAQLSVNPRRWTTCRYRAPGSSTWEEKPLGWMMEQIAERIRKTRDTTFLETAKIRNRDVTVNRCEGIAWFASAALDNEEHYLIAKLSRALGIVHLENSARIRHAATVPALAATFGYGATTTNLIDMAQADVVLATSDMAESHPVSYKWAMKAKERGATIIHVAPRMSRTSAPADLWVPIRPGTYIAFFGGLIRYAIEHEKYFHDYVVNYTNASFLVDRSFRTASDLNGLFSGYSPRKGRYVQSSWRFELDANGEPRRDPALRVPRSVFQLLRRHYGRYTPEVVERTCGIPRELFVKVAEIFCSASGPDRTATIAYGPELHQSTNGVQQIRALSLLQLLLGNVGRPGGGVVALGGPANVQGATDMATLHDALPGYMAMPLQRRHPTLAHYLARETPRDGFGVNTPKLFVSLLKAWWGDAATEDNDFAYHYLPKRQARDAYSYQHSLAAMLNKRVKGLICVGQNPAVDGPNAKVARQALRSLDWMVVVDLFETETAAVWNEPGIDPQSSGVEVFFVPGAPAAEKEGSFTSAMRLLQWHEKAVDPPGDARSEAAFVVDLGRRLKEGYRDSPGGKARPILDLTWDYELRGPKQEPAMEVVLKEVNGYAARHIDSYGTAMYLKDQPLGGFVDLRSDGSTACGNWIYSGVYPEDGQNLAARRETSHADDHLAHRWGFAWPANRRILYNRASADPAGNPWSDKKRLIWWDHGLARWVGLDEPDFSVTTAPSAPPAIYGRLRGIGGADPYIMHAHGKGQLFASLVDGPFPEHYEPFESPTRNALSRVRHNPVAKVFRLGDSNRLGTADPYPFILTTYGLAEHDASGVSRHLPWLAELFVGHFAEVHPELAQALGIGTGDVITVETPRGSIETRALVTARIQPLTIAGRRVYQVGIPEHWGWQGVGPSAAAGVSNDLVASLGDPTTFAPESKALLCNIRKGVV